jgi:hypothetical protein
MVRLIETAGLWCAWLMSVCVTVGIVLAAGELWRERR